MTRSMSPDYIESKIFWNYLRPITVIGVIIILVGLYWYGAEKQLIYVNADMHLIDQSAYMEYARNLYTSNYTYIGERNRMPVYPFLQSLIYRPGMTDEVFFVQGKYFNLALSLCLLAGLAFIFRYYFSWLYSANLLLIVAFTVFIFRAGYFQAELLFYFLSFCLFLLMWNLLQRMSWKLGVFAGIVAGIAHLTKASILPGFTIFVLLAGIKWVWATYQRRYSSSDEIFAESFLSDLLAILLVVVFFLVTIFPYINNSKRIFGRYFYNVNSSFYIWYDSWDEAKQGTRAHGDRVGWPEMPPSEIPSMAKYFREHTFLQIVTRFSTGGQKVINNIVGTYGYFKYLTVYLGILLFVVLRSWRQVYRLVISNPFFFLFLVLYFLTYIMLYFWYASIASGNRLILALFLPFIFTISHGLQKLLTSMKLKIIGKFVSPLVIVNLVLFPIILIDIFFVITERVETVFGGG